MKKILAIIFTLSLLVSITACGKDSKNVSVSTRETQVVTTLSPKTEISTTAPSEPVTTQTQPATDITVEEWIKNNQEIIDAYCKTANETIVKTYEGNDPNFNFEMKIEANGNEFIINSILSCDDEKTYNDFVEMFEYANNQVLMLSDEEEKEALALIPEQYGFIGMPIPESSTTIILDKDGNTIINFTYPSDTKLTTYNSVEEWFKNNTELVEIICEESSYTTDDGVKVTFSLYAEDNKLFFNGTLSGNVTEERIEFEIKTAKEEQKRWNALSNEEKLKGLRNIAMSFDPTMPIPDSIITLVYNEDGSKIAEIILSSDNNSI